MDTKNLLRLNRIQKRLRARLLRRMQDYGPRHGLTTEATRISLAIAQRIEKNGWAVQD